MGIRFKKAAGIVFLQFAVMVYSINTVVAKYVALEPWFSLKFILLYGLEFVVLGIYAILWQQIIKKVELSVAYANKAMTLLWSMLWGAILFHEGVTLPKVLGVGFVIAGTVILNSHEVETPHPSPSVTPSPQGEGREEPGQENNQEEDDHA
ncbi:MAG: transporter [Lachnospiraceae bacterium]|nr:transporter [Lachnospiraceae bacterium]